MKKDKRESEKKEKWKKNRKNRGNGCNDKMHRRQTEISSLLVGVLHFYFISTLSHIPPFSLACRFRAGIRQWFDRRRPRWETGPLWSTSFFVNFIQIFRGLIALVASSVLQIPNEMFARDGTNRISLRNKVFTHLTVC